MKKITAVILILLYGASSSGATVHFHYCMGKLQSVDLFSKSTDRCDNCGMTTAANPCCKDVHKTIKAQKDYKQASTGFSLPAVATATNNITITAWQSWHVSHIAPAPSSHGPPGGIPLFLKYRNFRV